MKVKEIMGYNFIGPAELEEIANDFRIQKPSEIKIQIPEIIYSFNFLNQVKDDHILILGIPYDCQNKPLTINQLRYNLGTNPEKREPCFYNQDWYVNEDFAAKDTLNFRWHLISKKVKEESRGKDPDRNPNLLKNKELLPTALLATFTFFAYYFCNNEILWQNDFIWCRDLDHNGDRIYAGRYIDPAGMNKNGFNIHRYLKIHSCYAIAPQIL